MRFYMNRLGSKKHITLLNQRRPTKQVPGDVFERALQEKKLDVDDNEGAVKERKVLPQRPQQFIASKTKKEHKSPLPPEKASKEPSGGILFFQSDGIDSLRTIRLYLRLYFITPTVRFFGVLLHSDA